MKRPLFVPVEPDVQAFLTGRDWRAREAFLAGWLLNVAGGYDDIFDKS
jgi:hypothetical protein